ncbi:hypothetical protein ACQY0O_000247 [Thecaphora frezii]
MADFSFTSPLVEAATAAAAAHPFLVSLLVLAAISSYKVLFSPILFPSQFRNIPTPKRLSWIFGNRLAESDPFVYTQPDGQQITVDGPALRYNYDAKELGTHVFAFPEPFGEESLNLGDPNALSYVLADTDSFRSPDLRSAIIELLGGQGIALHYGHVHRKQRRLIGPSFSTEHLASMTETFALLAEKMCKAIHHELDSQAQAEAASAEVDLGYWLDCAMLDIIGLTGFGYDFCALEKGREGSELSAAFNNTNQQAVQLSVARGMQVALATALHPPAATWPIEKINRALHNSKRVIARHSEAIVSQKKREIIEEAKVSGTASDVLSGRKDLLSLLIKANLESPVEDQMTDKDVAGQIHTFTFAGYETSSVTSSFVLFYLSTHLDVQRKLRDILDRTFKERKGIALKDLTAQNISYDDLWSDELEYLDRIIRETLRLCPPVMYSQRLAVKNAVIPLLQPIKSRDGKGRIESIPVKKGAVVQCNFKQANYREDLYGHEPESFNPDRWLDLPELYHRARIPQPYGMFSFSGGPKSCIGSKFSLTEMKTMLILLLRDFEFTPIEGIEIRPKVALVVRPVAQKSDGEMQAGTPLQVRRL